MIFKQHRRHCPPLKESANHFCVVVVDQGLRPMREVENARSAAAV